MSENENVDCDPKISSPKCTKSDVSNQEKDVETSVRNTFNLKDCSDAVGEVLKETDIPTPVENAELLKDDDESSVSDYDSASEEYSDPAAPFPFVEDEPCTKNELNNEDEEIEIDEEELKEVQKDWSDTDVEMHKEEALSLKNEGNDYFKSVKYLESIKSYTQALNTCPLKCSQERAVLYANRAAAKINLEQQEEAVLDCNKAIELNPDYLKAVLRRAQLHRKLENLDQSLADYQKVLELDPNSREAREECVVLPQKIAERNEKLKTEMLGKLKDLGNLVLRPFGLSTDNFNFVQDPNTGGYSVNFQSTKN